MQVTDEARYRLQLAQGFLEEARQDVSLERWRSCMDNSQLAVENAAKVILALLGPVGRTHNPATVLRQALAEGRLPEDIVARVKTIADHAESLGPDVHIESDYGDEAGGRTPWELFDEDDATQALALAEETVHLTEGLVEGITDADNKQGG